MSNTQEIIRKYQKQIDKFKNEKGDFEEIAMLLITHLYIEYFIDYIIKKHFKLKSKIFDDHRSYSFSIKLDLIYEKDFIPEWLYFNIRKLNSIRNKFSHNLHFDLLKADLIFKIVDDQNEIEIIDLRKGWDRRKTRQNRNRLLLVDIPILTLITFEAHIRRNEI